ncbi:MAG: hypothetical protein HF982_08530 [Desulfobacteraceae bacterium]|nr:hypothetical protein [Desulfobacteraceae bacterium]MBC2719614.1 hypothetical protein [Desulfobacteraceae bacterium]
MECGIFYFYKVFSRAFGEGSNEAEGLGMKAGGCRHDLGFRCSSNPGHINGV